MKHACSLTLFTLFAFGLTANAYGQEAKVEGHVYNNKGRPVASSRIVVTPGGQVGMTDSKGHFIISLPAHIQPGQAAQIRVERQNWVVFNPMFGKCTTQSTTRNFEPLRVVIVPKGSPLSYDPKRLSAFVDRLQKQVGTQAKTLDALGGRVDELERQRTRYALLEEYAENYGIPLDKFKAALDEWSRIKESDDALERARKEYWAGHLDKVIEQTREAGPASVQILKQQVQQSLKIGRTTIGLYTIEGNSFSQQYNFREALASYGVIEELFETHVLPREVLKAEWAETKLLIGNAKVALGVRVAGDESSRLLKEALEDYRQSATVYTREQSLYEWAATQNSLGNALSVLGVRVRGADSVKYLKDAVTSYRAALEGTRMKYPQEWAKTQTNLGIVLRNLGERVSGEESVGYLKEAVVAHHAALEVRTRDQLPAGWAATQHNLGDTLRSLSARVGGADGGLLLKEAVAAFRAALEVRTREKYPQEWAATQNNLGVGLWSLGQRTVGDEGITYLNEAAAVYRSALEVRTRQTLPQDWAITQNNLGITLSSLGERLNDATGIKHLRDAATAFRAALEVKTRDHFPQDWVATQGNLGIVLGKLGERVGGEEGLKHLKDAADAHRATLEVIPRAQAPQQWATAQNNLGSALQAIGERVREPESIRYLNESVDAFRAALEERPRQRLPQPWATTQNNLGNALRNLGERVGGDEGLKYLREAAEAHRAALEVLTRKDFPQLWVITQYNLAKDYSQLSNWLAAVEAFEQILTVDPDHGLAYEEAASIYHDILFRFDKAFALHQQWLKQHPEDVPAQVDFAESHFSAGLFAESLKLINKLSANPDIPAGAQPSLRAIEIACLLALGRDKQVASKLDQLIDDVSRQPVTFRVSWNFNGTRYFIDHNEKFISHRSWLGRLFDALANKDRQKMLEALNEVRGELKE